jgi:hypothetical protein
MNIKILSILTMTILLISGCASKDDRTFIDQVPTDLTNTFDLSSDQFNKFKVSEINVKKEVVTPSKKDVDKKKSKKVKIIEKKTVKKKKIQKIAEKPTPLEVVTGKKNIDLPADYPAVYKKWDKVSENIWNKFNANVFPGEEMIMEISFLGITVGAVRLKTHDVVEMGKNKAFHLSAALKSASYYSMIYQIDDLLTTYVETEQFFPMKYTLTQRESGQSVDDLQLYDLEKRETFFWYKRLKKKIETKHEKKGYIPGYLQNIFSALYFMRGLPLNNGASYTYPIVTRTKVWMMTMNVEKREKIKIMGKWVKAIKLNAYTVIPGEKKKNGTISFWYSDDSVKKLLDFKANVKIGHVEGKLIEYQAGKHYKREE